MKFIRFSSVCLTFLYLFLLGWNRFQIGEEKKTVVNFLAKAWKSLIFLSVSQFNLWFLNEIFLLAVISSYCSWWCYVKNHFPTEYHRNKMIEINQIFYILKFFYFQLFLFFIGKPVSIFTYFSYYFKVIVIWKVSFGWAISIFVFIQIFAK